MLLIDGKNAVESILQEILLYKTEPAISPEVAPSSRVRVEQVLFFTFLLYKLSNLRIVIVTVEKWPWAVDTYAEGVVESSIERRKRSWITYRLNGSGRSPVRLIFLNCGTATSSRRVYMKIKIAHSKNLP